MKIRLGLSPCPNDTFIFDALIHQKIDTEGLEFEFFFADIEQLNQWAFEGKLDVTKLSFNTFAKCISKYVLLDSGSALGRKCGPILIKKPSKILSPQSNIAIPGEHTTANLLLGISNPEYINKFEVIFSEIENEILMGNFDAGLIIHENRFTYQQKGLVSEHDLGEFWHEKTGLPLPLGAIVVKRLLHSNLQNKVNRILKKSVEYAFENPESSLEFVRHHAQEMDLHIINEHINLYVNNYTISLGEEGRQAVQLLFKYVGVSEKPERIFL